MGGALLRPGGAGADLGPADGHGVAGTITGAQIAPGFAVTRAVPGGEVPATALVIPDAPRKPKAMVSLIPRSSW